MVVTTNPPEVGAIRRKLEAFCEMPHFSRSWLEANSIFVHVRLSRRVHQSQVFATLDITNVTVMNGREQGKFKAFLSAAEDVAKMAGRTVYIENVQTERFAQFFRNRGYTEVREDWSGPSFLLLRAPNEEP